MDVADATEAHDVSEQIGDLVAQGGEETCFSVLWIRAGQTAREPKVGDTIQVLGGSRFVDPKGSGSYCEGDVGKVTSCECAVDSPEVASATVVWLRTGKMSVIYREALNSFRLFRMQAPRIGDLLVAAPGVDHIDATGVEHYAAGDSGSIVSLSAPGGSSECIMKVCWGRSGEVTECPFATWTTRFSLIPLQSNIPSYIRYPLGAINDPG
jgi:hypothetical protein